MLFPLGSSARLRDITRHAQGRAQPQTRCVPVSLTGLLFCPRPSSSLPTDASQPDLFVQCPWSGKLWPVRGVGWSGGRHVARPQQQSCGQGCWGPGGLRSVWLLLQAVLCTVLSPSLPSLPPKPFPPLRRPRPVCT